MKEATARDLFVDTSFWFSTLHPPDAHYRRAGELWMHVNEDRSRLHCTREVVGETLTLLRYRASARAALRFLDTIVPDVHVIDSPREFHEHAMHLFRRWAPNRRVSYCDVLSFVVVRGMLNDAPCLAFDQDFVALGLTVIG